MKISASLAKSLANDIVATAFATAVERAFDDESHDLFNDVVDEIWSGYYAHLGLNGKEAISILRDGGDLTKGLFKRVTSLRVYTASGAIGLSALMAAPNLARDLPYKEQDQWTVNVSKELSAKVLDYAFRLKDATQKRNDEVEAVKASILGFSTWQRLREGWPEIAAQIDNWEPEPTTRAIVNVSAINARLGLPIAEAA